MNEGLEDIVSRKIQDDQQRAAAYSGNLYGDEQHDRPADPTVERVLRHLESAVYIQTAENELLDGKHDDLNTLECVHGGDILHKQTGTGNPNHENHKGRNMEQHRIRDDHRQRDPRNVAIAHDEAHQIQSRVEHEREAGYHADPAEFGHYGACDPVTGRDAVGQQETDCVQGDAPCCD